MVVVSLFCRVFTDRVPNRVYCTYLLFHQCPCRALLGHSSHRWLLSASRDTPQMESKLRLCEGLRDKWSSFPHLFGSNLQCRLTLIHWLDFSRLFYCFHLSSILSNLYILRILLTSAGMTNRWAFLLFGPLNGSNSSERCQTIGRIQIPFVSNRREQM